MTCITSTPLIQDGAFFDGAEKPSAGLEAATIPQLAVLFDLMEKLEDTLLGVAAQPRAEGFPAYRAEELMIGFDAERSAIVAELRRRRPADANEAERRMSVLVRHAIADGESVHGVLQVALECAAARH